MANAEALSALLYASSAPDGAAMAAEQEADRLMMGEWNVADYFPVYNDLVDEYLSRNPNKWTRHFGV